jgi:hypothetical protein
LSASLKEISILAFAAQAFSSIELPQGLEVIGPGAFSTTLLRSISFPDSLTTIEKGAFTFTYELESITLPSSLTTLKRAFRFSEVKSVDMSACVALETIGDYAFYECFSLTEVTLPPNIKRIEDSFFRDCSSLEVIDLPATVEYIGYRAITSVRTLIVRSIEPPEVDMYGDFPLSASVIYVPDESIEEYKTAIGWSKYAERLYGLSAYQE